MDSQCAANVIQKTWRMFSSRNNNLYLKLRKTAHRFETELRGYHYICDQPVKEAVWEEVNKNSVGGVCDVTGQANGGHKSGVDMYFDKCGISNKTAKISPTGATSISSFRLTTVCSDKMPGCPEDIIAEIEKREESYEYYSVLFRKEDTDKVTYHWCVIPKHFFVFNIHNPESFQPKVGVRGKNKDKQVGWTSKQTGDKYCRFEISFAMSSQLWYHFKFADVEKYTIHTVTVSKDDMAKLSYSDIFNLVKKQ